MRFSADRTASDLRSIGMSVALAVVSGCLITSVLLLCLRRAMGALSQPLPGAGLVATLLGVVLAASLARFLWSLTRPANALVRFLPSLLILLLAAALWVPGTTAAGAVLLCVAVGLDLGVAAGLESPLGDALRRRLTGLRAMAERSPGIRRFGESRDSAEELPPDVSQHFTRRRIPAGGEVIEGTLRATFAAGQRTDHYHVAFCPPLEVAPHVVCEQIDGPSARIKVAQVLPQGLRLELRLEAAAAAATEIVLQVVARCEPSLTSPGPKHKPAGKGEETAGTPRGR